MEIRVSFFLCWQPRGHWQTGVPWSSPTHTVVSIHPPPHCWESISPIWSFCVQAHQASQPRLVHPDFNVTICSGQSIKHSVQRQWLRSGVALRKLTNVGSAVFNCRQNPVVASVYLYVRRGHISNRAGLKSNGRFNPNLALTTVNYAESLYNCCVAGREEPAKPFC